ncbi:glutamate-5-semialdehyde dehydrogenase [Alkalinema sp. FACHB-956]|uniref:glutamate-5-semialdehyde dehydrogenase n=1 Tax=Alkalinema sp. FACHB-956 TaxID=2692768 RepID=UPI0016873B7B|nr:glutamate-5-semialdehyde dehydrogenase [Alkalinema sp. FACHB-956]MBD2327024.1 glutamate-5-semialdehyde dehydrogenase [Alkalinema sp. FACHB-956]
MTALQAQPDLLTLAQQTRTAARSLASQATEAKNQALHAIADALAAQAPAILAANQADCEAAQRDGISSALYARLKLDEAKLQSAIVGVRDVAKLPDPIGQIQLHRELDAGLVMKRLSCPLGVLGVIFEARPDAVMQISSLAVKSGNGVILKGGKEAVHSCEALVKAIHQGLQRAGLDPNSVQLLTTREETLALLKLDQYVDLIIPRGSNSFVRFVQENTRIPVLGHADGICHLYVDAAADLAQAVTIAVDAKTQYPAACNAIETLLVHQSIADVFLPQVAQALQSKQVELRGDAPTQQILPGIQSATETDWATEYSDLVLAIRVVDSLAAAIDHINTYGSRHTEAIVTEDAAAAATFMGQVDAAGVYQNCSTRFADGFRYGFGAEVGISTQKMPPRGPVGLEGLVTYKYQMVGAGHLAATYAGKEAKPFTHRDL